MSGTAITVTLPNPEPDWIYEGMDPTQWEDATGIVINRAPKELLENDEALATAINQLATTQGTLNQLASLDFLTSPNTAQLNAFLCGSLDDSGNQIVAVANGNNYWTFLTHQSPLLSGLVASATATGITSTSIGTLVASLTAGRYIIQFTTGVYAGYAKLITTTTANAVSWANALPGNPAANDQFTIYSSNAFMFSTIAQVNANSLVNAIVFGG